MKIAIITTLLVIGVIALLLFLFRQNFSNQSTTVIVSPTAKLLTPTPTLKVIKPSASPTPQTFATKKKQYSIALIGDSYIDTMGENMEYLDKALSKRYPATKFTLYNYGIGAQNVEMVSERFESSFTNREKNYPPIPSINADIIILGSCAYNPFDPHDRDRHYKGLIQLIEKAKATGTQVYVLREIAPLKEDFGKGPHGINISPQAAAEHSQRITEQLENAKNAASATNVGLIDAHTPSLSQGEGYRPYVNADDGIHPSVMGHTFMANLISRTLNLQ